MRTISIWIGSLPKKGRKLCTFGNYCGPVAQDLSVLSGYCPYCQGERLISFDLNPRASFWKGREKELSAAFAEIASRSDILIGNEEDFQLCRGIKDPEAGGKGLDDKIGSFKEMIGRVRKAYPNAPWFGTTLREVISANSHMWGALATDGKEREIIKPREIGVIPKPHDIR